MLLSILIPTVEERKKQFLSLVNYIISIYTGLDVEIIHLCDNKEMSIGEKRNRLYNMANGLYAWQIDDDDSISQNSIHQILQAIQSGADCITFKEHCTINGIEKRSNISLQYKDWEGEGHHLLHDGFHYHRTPFFKTPIKTEICRQIPVADIRYGEDHDFARRVKPLLKAEQYINEFIYLYYHNSSPHNQRYGIVL